MERRRKNNIIIGTLCCVLVLMGVGYAILSTTLNIGATANITGDFDIHFTNIQRSSSTITDTTLLNTMDAGTGITDGTNNHEGTFTAVLQKPTDYVIYTVSVANTGSIDGYLTFTFGDEHNNFNYYKDFYSVEFIRDDVDPDISTDILQPNATFTDSEVLENTTGTRTYKIKVMFKESASGFPDATTNGAFECSLNLTYSQQAPVQSNNNGGNQSQSPVLRIMQTASGTSVDQPVSEYGVSNLNQGDLLQFDTEQFYVLDVTQNNLKLLSRYLINVGTNKNPNLTEGLQNANIGYTASRDMDEFMAESEQGFLYGAVSFSSTNYWWDSTNSTYASGYSQHGSVYSGSLVQGYVNSYVTTLSTMGLNVTSGTVLSIQELGVICENIDFTQNSGATSGCPNYVFETSYWLSSVWGCNYVWTVDADGFVGNGDTYFDDNNYFGLRPVINVTIS